MGMPFPVSGAVVQTASTGKVFGENTGVSGEDDFPRNRKARPCRWNRAGCDLCLRTGMAPSFPFPAFPAFREREDQVEPRVKGHRRIESNPFLPFEPFDKPGRAGGEELLQMLVRQFLVQELAEHEQAAAPVVAFGRPALEDDMRSICDRAFSQLPVRETSATSMSFTAP